MGSAATTTARSTTAYRALSPLGPVLADLPPQRQILPTLTRRFDQNLQQRQGIVEPRVAGKPHPIARRSPVLP